jgi:Zn-dependent alcohol dehydrogenase
LYRAGKLDLDRMITRRIKIDEINDAMRRLERGEVVRQVIEF